MDLNNYTNANILNSTNVLNSKKPNNACLVHLIESTVCFFCLLKWEEQLGHTKACRDVLNSKKQILKNAPLQKRTHTIRKFFR